MQQDGGSSVEEILESIKKVIARDTGARLAAARQRQSDAGNDAGDDSEDTLPQLDPTTPEEADEILDLGSDAIVEDDGVSQESHAVDERDPADDEDYDVDTAPLTNASARNSMRDNLAALAMLAEPGVPPQIVRTGETSLEGLTRELMRPMLAEWLDNNLPGMVEKLVKAEISRIAGKRD
ncbi:MAG: DUF2497 domain-containing protein [Pontixanthobacter sp.]